MICWFCLSDNLIQNDQQYFPRSNQLKYQDYYVVTFTENSHNTNFVLSLVVLEVVNMDHNNS